MDAVPDRIEKHIHLKASVARVWRALSDSKEFGTWFGMEVDGPFEAGKRLKARIKPTRVDPAVAKMQEPHAGFAFEIAVEQVEFERLISFRWLPYPIDPGDDLANHPTTLATFSIRPEAGGTHLTITESGFDKIPLERRVETFTSNEHGWELQTKLIEKYVTSYAP